MLSKRKNNNSQYTKHLAVKNVHQHFGAEFFRSGNMSKFLNESTDVIDCEKYFDLDSINRYVEFDKPLYSIVQKYKTARLLYISPREYLERIAKGFGISYQKTTTGSAVFPEKVKKYAERMKAGEKAPVIYYTKDGDYQEGRHRALAAMSLGCTKIPVIEFQKLNSNEVESFVLKFKDKSFEELSQYFIDKGFENGITRLGWRDMQAFIRENIQTEIRKHIRTALNEQFIILENPQQADKYFFNVKDYLTPEDREFILSITGGDGYTFKVTELLNQYLSFSRNQNRDESVEIYREKLEKFYNALKSYDKNFFPINGFNINQQSDDIYSFSEAVISRYRVIEKFKQLPSLVQRNLKHLKNKTYNQHGLAFNEVFAIVNTAIKSINHVYKTVDEETAEKIIRKTFNSKDDFYSAEDYVEKLDSLLAAETFGFNKVRLEDFKKTAQNIGAEILEEGPDFILTVVDSFEQLRQLTCNVYWCVAHRFSDFENHTQIVPEMYVLLQTDPRVKNEERILLYTEDDSVDYEDIDSIRDNGMPEMNWFDIQNNYTQPFASIDHDKLINRIENLTSEFLDSHAAA